MLAQANNTCRNKMGSFETNCIHTATVYVVTNILDEATWLTTLLSPAAFTPQPQETQIKLPREESH